MKSTKKHAKKISRIFTGRQSKESKWFSTFKKTAMRAGVQESEFGDGAEFELVMGIKGLGGEDVSSYAGNKMAEQMGARLGGVLTLERARNLKKQLLQVSDEYISVSLEELRSSPFLYKNYLKQLQTALSEKGYTMRAAGEYISQYVFNSQ